MHLAASGLPYLGSWVDACTQRFPFGQNLIVARQAKFVLTDKLKIESKRGQRYVFMMGSPAAVNVDVYALEACTVEMEPFGELLYISYAPIHNVQAPDE